LRHPLSTCSDVVLTTKMPLAELGSQFVGIFLLDIDRLVPEAGKLAV